VSHKLGFMILRNVAQDQKKARLVSDLTAALRGRGFFGMATERIPGAQTRYPELSCRAPIQQEV
jgi:hypothetical protein